MRFSFIKNKFKLLRKRSAHRLKIFLKYHFKRSEKSPVFVIAARRTGSTLLLSYLNSIPGVSFDAEILNKEMFYGLRDRFISKRAALDHILHSVNHCRHRICGVKFLRLHLESHQLKMSDLRKILPQAKFIILYRKSLLEQYISLKAAEITHHWVWTKNYKLPSSIHVDPAEFRVFCASIRAFYKEILGDAWLRERFVLLRYEELTDDAQTVFNSKIFPFLNLPSSPISSPLVKQNPKKPHEIIENFDEVKGFEKELMVLDEK